MPPILKKRSVSRAARFYDPRARLLAAKMPKDEE
jgi:hypothetical protein